MYQPGVCANQECVLTRVLTTQCFQANIVIICFFSSGAGAKALAEAVVRACEQPSHFKLLYPLASSIEEKIEIIAKEIYRADGIELSQEAKEQIERYKKQGGLICLFICCFVLFTVISLFVAETHTWCIYALKYTLLVLCVMCYQQCV